MKRLFLLIVLLFAVGPLACIHVDCRPDEEGGGPCGKKKCHREEGDKPCDKSGGKPCDKPCDKSDGKPCDKPCDKHEGQQAGAESFRRASTEELSLWMEKKEVKVIDNNKEEVYKAGHIPGAVNMAFDQVTAEKLGEDKEARLVFYCANLQCSACHKAADAAIALGYTNVWIYAPGIAGWKEAGKKVEK